MGDFTGPALVLILGLAVGLSLHAVWRRFWAAVALTTVAATVVWVGGCYLMFVLTAPSELGPPQLIPIALTAGTAMVGAVGAGSVIRFIRGH